MMTIIHNGAVKAVPACSVFEATLNPLQKTAERNGNGKMIRETLPDKWTLKMEWEFKTPQDFYEWFNYLKALTRVDFTVQFPAPTGNLETATFYISPISATMLSMRKGTSGMWKNLKCNFVEV